MSRRYEPLASVWVIVRVDLYHLRESRVLVLSEPHRFVTVKEVLDTEEKAQVEVARLNDLHPDKAVVYFYEQGRSLRPETEADER